MNVEPLTADDLFPVVVAYRLAAAVRAMAELGIPDILAAGPRSATDIAGALGVDPGPLGRLLRMLAARGALVLDDDGRFGNSGLSVELVAGEKRDLTLGWAAPASLMGAWSQIAAAIREGTSAYAAAHGCDREAYLDDHPDERAAYARAMGSTVEGFEAIAAGIDLAHATTLVSVGGGQGVELVPLLRRWPLLRGVLADLPAALEGADEVLARHGVAARVELVACDAREDVPAGDAYVLSTVLRCLPDDDVVRVLRSCAAAARPGATMHVVEMPLPEDGLDAALATADLTAWVAYGGGDRTVTEWARLHEQGGWTGMATVALDGPFVAMTTRRAAAG